VSKIRVLLVDDHTIVREGLRALLGYYEDIEVVGEAQDGEAAIARVGELQPDIVVMDIVMPKMNGLEATRQIRQQYPQTRVIVLTQHEDRQYVLSLIQAGVSGYVLKRALGTDLVNALRTVSNGGTSLDPMMTTTVVGKMRRQKEGGVILPEALTAREREILSYIAQGKTNSQIATLLCLSVNTIVWHRGNLMSKLGIHKATDLVRYALENGLIEPNRDVQT
jgi:DNA-binding NarL/FixJ family response regulator